MKIVLVSVAFLLTVFPSTVGAQSWQEVSSHLFTNAAIVWQATTKQLPKNLLIYRRSLPRFFPTAVISNAMALGSLQSRGLPPASTNDFYILKPEPPNWPGPIPPILGIRPNDASVFFWSPDEQPVSQAGVPNDEILSKLAVKYAPQLGLEPAELTEAKLYTRWRGVERTADNFFGRGVFFPRHLGGIPFFSPTDDGEGAEGFSMEFGEGGKIEAFFIRWAELEPDKSEAVASEDEITRCLYAHKAIVRPNHDEGDFKRLRRLAMAKRFTITKITPYYEEGIFGETPTNDAPARFATPFAELEAAADFGNSNEPVKFFCPILSSEARRLLTSPGPK